MALGEGHAVAKELLVVEMHLALSQDAELVHDAKALGLGLGLGVVQVVHLKDEGPDRARALAVEMTLYPAGRGGGTKELDTDIKVHGREDVHVGDVLGGR